MPSGKPREGVPPNRLGSKARCDALVRIEKQIGHPIFWVLAGGFSKESPGCATSQAPTSIAHDMSLYLAFLGYSESLHGYRSWGTYKETESIIEHIADRSRFNNKTEVYVSTNLGHMPRVMLCWFFLKPKGWKVYFVRAKHSFTFWPEYFQETAKFFQYLYRFLSKKW